MRVSPIQQRHQVLHEGAVLLRYEGGQAGFGGVKVSPVIGAEDDLAVLTKGLLDVDGLAEGPGRQANQH